jgi:hypothetical protein
MTEEELDAFLDEARTLRLATVTDQGWPVATPVWFVWHDGAFWIWNLRRARRTGRLLGGGKVSVTVDDGTAYGELRGVLALVRAEAWAFEDVPPVVPAAFGRRYLPDGGPVRDRDDHQWIRLLPVRVRSWDFRKLPTEVSRS